MTYVIEKLTFPEKERFYLKQGDWGSVSYWDHRVSEAHKYETKDDAVRWALMYNDAIARELNGRCLLWLETFNRYAYIKEVIGESTVTWTDDKLEAGIFSYEECRQLSRQYQTQIEEV